MAEVIVTECPLPAGQPISWDHNAVHHALTTLTTGQIYHCLHTELECNDELAALIQAL